MRKGRFTFERRYKRQGDGYCYRIKTNGREVGIYDPGTNTLTVRSDYDVGEEEDPEKFGILLELELLIQQERWQIGERPSLKVARHPWKELSQ